MEGVFEALHVVVREDVLTRGEQGADFIPLAGGRTRLEGSTLYTLDIAPELYWRPWAEWLLHAIHHRVLEHIKVQAEASVSSKSGR